MRWERYWVDWGMRLHSISIRRGLDSISAETASAPTIYTGHRFSGNSKSSFSKDLNGALASRVGIYDAGMASKKERELYR